MIVGKRQRRLSDMDTVVLSLSSRGLTSGEIRAHFAEVYVASVPADTTTRITDTVLAEMAAWWLGPLERIHAAIFIDVINAVTSDALVQTCIIHLIRNSFRYVSRKAWDQLSRDLRPNYTVSSETAALLALNALTDERGDRYPAKIPLWRNGWSEFVPFLDYDLKIRTVICPTNAIESPRARNPRAVKARGHYPNTQAAMKTLYLVTRALDPNDPGRTRWAVRWKPALTAFAITFANRMPAAATN